MTLVLVVDDVPALAEQYAYDLHRLGGYEVRLAGDGREALDRLASEPVDCVILDLEMPGMDGFDVLRALVRSGSEVPVIVYTGTGDYDRCIQAVRLGAYGFVDKAEPVERIVRDIELALERRRLQARGSLAPPAARRREHARGEQCRRRPAARADRPRRAGAKHGADPRRERHGQGAGRARAAPARLAAGRPVRRHQLRRAAGAPDRERAVRTRARRVHRRERDPPRGLRGGGRRHAVPRRDRRAAAVGCRRSSCACWRSGGSTRSASDPKPRGRRARRRGHEPRPGSRDRGQAASARTCSTGSTCSRSWCRRCATGGATSPRSRSGSPRQSANGSACGPSGSRPTRWTPS